jgi:hypothetical protein
MLLVSVEWHRLRGHPNDRAFKNGRVGTGPSAYFVCMDLM